MKTTIHQRDKDSWFLLKNANVAKIRNISNERLDCEVYSSNHLSDYFTSPCSSSRVGIYYIPERISSRISTVSQNDLQRKCVCLLVNNGIVIVSLLNNVVSVSYTHLTLPTIYSV